MIGKIRKVKLVKGLCVATALVAMFLVWGCDDSDSVGDEPTPTPAPTPTPTPAKVATVTGEIGAAGGTITADPEDEMVGSATITVPANAVTEETTIEFTYATGDQEDEYPEADFSATDQAGGGTFKSVGFVSVAATDSQGVVTELGEPAAVIMDLDPNATDDQGQNLQAGDTVELWVKDYAGSSKRQFTAGCNGMWTFLGTVIVQEDSDGNLYVSFNVVSLCHTKLYFSCQWLTGVIVPTPTPPTGTGGTGGGATT